MIKLTTGSPASGMTCPHSVASAKPQSIGWQNVHALAVQSMAIVVHQKPAPAAFAFKVEVIDFGAPKTAAEGAPLRGEGAAATAPPVGNTGGTFLRSVNHG